MTKGTEFYARLEIRMVIGFTFRPDRNGVQDGGNTDNVWSLVGPKLAKLSPERVSVGRTGNFQNPGVAIQSTLTNQPCVREYEL